MYTNNSKQQITMTLVFDDRLTVGYPSYGCPLCNSRFFGGGPAIHTNCTEKGYKNCITYIGSVCIARIKSRAGICGENSPDALCGITWSQLKQQLPEQCKD